MFFSHHDSDNWRKVKGDGRWKIPTVDDCRVRRVLDDGWCGRGLLATSIRTTRTLFVPSRVGGTLSSSNKRVHSLDP